MENLIQLNVVASFDVLISVENPNKVDVNLDLGSGSFKYEGIEFGTFEVNSMSIEAESITDDIVTVSFTPLAPNLHPTVMLKQAVSGSLNITVDALMGVSFPRIMGYSFSRKWDGYTIDFSHDASAGLLQNRRLCACDF